MSSECMKYKDTTLCGKENCIGCEYERTKVTREEVNHPNRYSEECSLECIEVMKLVFNDEIVTWFCLCNAFKYLWRYKSKNGEQDLNKARWYLNYIKDSNISQRQTQIKDLLYGMLSSAYKYYS